MAKNGLKPFFLWGEKLYTYISCIVSVKENIFTNVEDTCHILFFEKYLNTSRINKYLTNSFDQTVLQN